MNEERDDHSDNAEEIQRTFFEHFFRGYVEDGSLVIADRSIKEIFDDWIKQLLQLVLHPNSDQFELWPTFDHKGELRSRALAEAEGGDDHIAITLYMTWVEHFINGLLSSTFQRKGYSSKVYMPLLRELRLSTKASSLWTLVELPPIEERYLKLIDQGANIRNAFVHYKWAAVPEAEGDRQLAQIKEVVAGMEGLVQALSGIESKVIWNDREDEIMEHLRVEIRISGDLILP